MITKVTMELSRQSIKKTKQFLKDYNEAVERGCGNAILKATELMYNKVIQLCYANGISNHVDLIKWSYDAQTKIGKVWTTDMVLIFNEMGTGIVGLNNPHPSSSEDFSSWKYDVNNHGEKGWWYPKEDGTYGWTKGLPSRHMFFDAFNYIKSEIGNTVNVEIIKTMGDV